MCRRDPKLVLFLLGATLGVISGLAWYFGYAPSLSAALPYALAVTVTILVTTAVFQQKCSFLEQAGGFPPSLGCFRMHRYSPLIFVPAMVAIAAILAAMALSLIHI